MHAGFQKALTTCLISNDVDVANRELDDVKKLLIANEKVDPSNSATWGLFTLAVCNKRSDVAKLLVQNGLDVRARMKPLNQTPLHLAADAGDLETAKFLVGNNAEAQAKDQKKRTPAKLAQHNGYMELARFLDPNVSNPIAAPDSPTKTQEKRLSKLAAVFTRQNKGNSPN